MKFENIKVVEDSHQQFNKRIKVSKKHMLSDITTMAEVEKFEATLEDMNIPYVLAQVEVTVPHPSSEIVRDKDGNIQLQYRYLRGYALFVTIDEMDTGYHPEIRQFVMPRHSQLVKDMANKEKKEKEIVEKSA